MGIQSIRFKIVLWYMLILSVTLTVLGAILYHNFQQKLTNDMNNLLRSRAGGITESIDTYWEAEHLQSGLRLQDQFTKFDNLNFTKIAERWVDDKNTDPALVGFIVRIFDGKGNLIASSKDITAAGLNSAHAQDIKRGQSFFEDIAIELSSSKTTMFRSFTRPVIEKGRLAYIVQVASPLSGLRSALNHLSILLLLLLPATVILTGLCGSFLAMIALRPVHDMIETIHQITAENLKLRINMPQTKDEIYALALTFNKMIQRLDDSFSSQRQFMEDISHELKTPLSVLKGELEVTLKKIRSAHEYENTLQSSLEEVNRLVRIVENLLMLARFDTKTVSLEPKSVELISLIQDVVQDMQVLAQQKQVALSFNRVDEILVQADMMQLKRLFLNLLDNAVKYTPNGGKVSVMVQRQTHTVEVEIIDNGVGISSQEMDHIFDRFYRVDKSRSTAGFGLGLSIAQSIAWAHNGDIKVRSNPGGGSVFVVTLPV